MERAAIVIGICTVSAFLAGCAHWSCQLPSWALRTPEDVDGLLREVEEIVVPLGFAKVPIEPGDGGPQFTVITYTNAVSVPYQNDPRWVQMCDDFPLLSLFGICGAPSEVNGEWRCTEDNLGVAVDLENRKVVVYDFCHRSETPFVRSLKERLEERLKARYGPVKLKFGRDSDPFR